MEEKEQSANLDMINVAHAVSKGGGTVWVVEGDSPQTDPTKKMEPVFSKMTLYKDGAFRKLCKLLEGEEETERAGLIFAIPGSGKSRTVAEAARAVRYEYCRLVCRDTYTDAIRCAIDKHCADDGKERQNDVVWKARIREIVKPLVQESMEAKKLDRTRKFVLHWDEAQTIMSETIVSREAWNSNETEYEVWLRSVDC